MTVITVHMGYPSLIRKGTNVCGHSAIYRKFISVEWRRQVRTNKICKLQKHKSIMISTTHAWDVFWYDIVSVDQIAHGKYDCRTAILTMICYRSLVSDRLYTTIENPSYFFMTLSCTEAIQSFISHFNKYSLVNPSWGNIPSWVWQGVNHCFRKLRRRVWHHRHFGNWISWK